MVSLERRIHPASGRSTCVFSGPGPRCVLGELQAPPQSSSSGQTAHSTSSVSTTQSFQRRQHFNISSLILSQSHVDVYKQLSLICPPFFTSYLGPPPPLGLCLDCQTPSIFLILFHLSPNSAYLTLPCLSHYSVYCHNTQPIWHFPVCPITQSTVMSLSLFDIYFPVCLITQSIVTSLSLFDISLSVSLLSLLSQHSAYLTFSCVSHYSVYCHDTQPIWHLFPCLSHYSVYLTFPCPSHYSVYCHITQPTWHFPVSHYSVYCHITQPIWHFPVCLITQSTVTFTWPIWHFCLSQQPEYLCFLAQSIVSLLLCWITQSTVSSLPHYSDPSPSHYSMYCLFTQPISDLPVPQVWLLSRSLTFRYPITQLILIFPWLITQSISVPPSQYSVYLTFPCLNTQSVSDFPLSHYSVYLRLSPVS